MSSRYKITVVTDNVNEPESFAAKAYRFDKKFLVVEGFWDTYFISTDILKEIRVVEFEDWEYRIEVTPEEWQEQVDKAKLQDQRLRSENIRKAAIANINGGRDVFIVGDAEWLDDAVKEASADLKEAGWHLKHKGGGEITIKRWEKSNAEHRPER